MGRPSRGGREKRSLVWRLSLPLAGLFALILLAYGTYTADRQLEMAERLLEQQGRLLAKGVAAAIAEPLLVRDLDRVEGLLAHELSENLALAIQVVDATGRLVADVETAAGAPVRRYGRAAPPRPSDAAEATSEGIGERWSHWYSAPDEARSLWQPIGGGSAASAPIGWVRLVLDLAPIHALQRALLATTLPLLLLSIAAAVAAVFWLSRRPLRELQHAAHFAQMLDTRSGEQVEGSQTVKEIDDLFGALNAASTSLARQEAELKSGKQFLEAVTNTLGEGLYVIDRAGRCTFMNAEAERLTGWSRQSLRGEALWDQLAGGGAAGPDPQAAALAGGRVVRSEDVVFRRRDAGAFPVGMVAAPLRLDGATTGVVVAFQDITQRKQLEAVGKQFEAIVEASDDAIISQSADGIVTSWNPAAERMFGYAAPEMIGQPVARLFPPARIAEEDAILRRLQQGENITHFETERVRKDGTVIPIAVTLSPLLDAGGNVIGASKIARDITEHKRAESQLLEYRRHLEALVQIRTAAYEKARHEAEHANQAKSDFLANMSHEIRTPMNAIIGYAQLLGRQDLPTSAGSLVAKITTASNALLGIINDILDISKIDARRLEIEHAPFRLSQVLDHLASIVSSAVGSKPLELVIQSAATGEDRLVGDSLRLGQVLLNLVSNAIKFTPSGEVLVGYERLPDAAGPGQVALRFFVRDTGIGIARDKLETIFQPFTQGDTSISRSFGGTGLGLTISRNLVTLMGGRLDIESEPGAGSEFSFTLSFDRDAGAEPVASAAAPLRILVADDRPSVRAVVAAIVADIGWTADLVDDGAAAVARARDAAERYAAILLDWRMPGMDGLAAARRIRAENPLDATPILLMVSADDREKIEALGKPGHNTSFLLKPVTRTSLEDAIAEACNPRAAATTARARGALLPLAGLRLLVVDDSDVNRDLAAEILVSEGAAVTSAASGEEALAILKHHPTAVDLVLMDIQMPVTDGYATTRAIRAEPALARLPIVALTAVTSPDQQQQALAAGMDDFIGKPFQVDDLVATVLRRAHRAAAAPAAAGRAAPTAGAPAPLADVLIDIPRGVAFWGSRAPYLRSLRKFAEIHAHDADALLLASPDAGCQIAHKLKGAASQLSLNALARLAGEVEVRLQRGAAIAELEAALRPLLERTLAAIAEYAAAASEPRPRTGPVPAAGHGAALAAEVRERLLRAFDCDDPGAIEPVLDELAPRLPAELLSALREAVGNYDFRGAERQLLAATTAAPTAPVEPSLG